MNVGTEVSAKHVFRTTCGATPCDRPGFCPICDGGLAVCAVCGLAEGALTTDCPGIPATMEQMDQVYAGDLDYRAGVWVNACSGHSPTSYRQAVGGYSYPDGADIDPDGDSLDCPACAAPDDPYPTRQAVGGYSYHDGADIDPDGAIHCEVCGALIGADELMGVIVVCGRCNTAPAPTPRGLTSIAAGLLARPVVAAPASSPEWRRIREAQRLAGEAERTSTVFHAVLVAAIPEIYDTPLCDRLERITARLRARSARRYAAAAALHRALHALPEAL
jgi:hypothetical protein